jgi:hypothetical protein
MLVGMLVGAVNGTSIFFIRNEPHKAAVFAATIMRNAFVGLLTYYSLNVQTRWWGALLSGTVYGLMLGLVVVLAKGGLKDRQHLVILPFSALTGAAIGLLLWKLYY